MTSEDLKTFSERIIDALKKYFKTENAPNHRGGVVHPNHHPRKMQVNNTISRHHVHQWDPLYCVENGMPTFRSSWIALRLPGDINKQSGMSLYFYP